jgi:hypothetical protein
MRDYLGDRVVLVVAQKPFESSAPNGVFHQFGTLLPVLDEDGLPLDPYDFPANGDVWWMLRPTSRGLAQPGKLLIGVLEESLYSGQPDKAHYQVVADSVEPLHSRDYIEIIDVAAQAIGNPRQLVSRKAQVVLDHVPVDQVFVRWHGQLYGPLRTQSDPDLSRDGHWRVGFTPAQADSVILEMPDTVLAKLPAGADHQLQAVVSLDNRPPAEVSTPHTCHYRLVAAREFQNVVPHDAQRIVLLTDDAIIQRTAKRFFTRAKRQEFQRLLNELQETIAGSGEELRNDEAESLAELTGLLQRDEEASTRIAKALLETGFLDAKVRNAIECKTEEFVVENAARLQTEINRKIEDLRWECEELEKRRESLENDLDAIKRDRHRELESELNRLREACRKECEEERQRLEKQIQELNRQRHALSENLTKVAQEFEKNRDEVVNQFLAISPLLQQFGLLPDRRETQATPATPTAATESSQPEFLLPDYINRNRPQAHSMVQETDFFERLCRHVEDSGFRYRPIDLLSFHLSVKCGDLAILGGLPGTGKSSLPRLYAEALVGDDYESCRQRYLQINVSPSWLDMRDLLGHVNALDRSFQPSESHLYEHLIWAQEEATCQGGESGIYLICLDEMNLAHVEHYFSGFLQVLENTDGVRALRCFAADAVSPASTFAKWSTISLPRSLRFVGTVNFDETTKQLSQRLLDRANLIRLPSAPLPLELKEPLPVKPRGTPITLRNLRSWITITANYEQSLGELIDALRDHLTALGCPMNPRRFSAMRKFIASMPPELGKPEQALDLQIAQRLLPQIRGMFRPVAREALDRVRKILENHSCSESLRVLEEISDREYPYVLLEEGGLA